MPTAKPQGTACAVGKTSLAKQPALVICALLVLLQTSPAIAYAGTTRKYADVFAPSLASKVPVLRLVRLTDSGWSHVCTTVAIVDDAALTAGHCLNMFVTVRVGPTFYYITSHKRLVDEGVGRDLGRFRFRSTAYDGPRAYIAKDMLVPGTVLWFIGYPRGVLSGTRCVYTGRWRSNVSGEQFAGTARCDLAISVGASGSPLFLVGGNEFVVSGIVTHLYNREYPDADSSRDVIFTILPDGLRLIQN